MQSSTLSQTESAELTNKVGLTLENTTQLLNNLLFWSKNQMDGIKANPEKLDVYQESYKLSKDILLELDGIKGKFRLKEQLLH